MERRLHLTADSDVEAFAIDLYNYLISIQKLMTQTLEEVLNTNLKLENVQPVIEKSYFNLEIGKAVLCSQYLLRSFCQYFFKHPTKGILKSEKNFITNLSVVIFSWTRFRNNIFFKFIDTCAIVAEAIMFCEKSFETTEISTKYSHIFSYFFDCNLKYEFYKSGGWEQLQKQAFEKYSYIYSFMWRFMENLTEEDCILYSCPLFKCINNSLVFFPVEYSEVCRYCFEQLNDQSYHVFNISEQFIQFHERIGSSSEQKTQAIKSIETDVQELLQNSKSKVDDETVTANESLLCLFVGKIDSTEFTESRRANKLFPDRIKRKRFSDDS